jgi:hypothetical protein
LSFNQFAVVGHKVSGVEVAGVLHPPLAQLVFKKRLYEDRFPSLRQMRTAIGWRLCGAAHCRMHRHHRPGPLTVLRTTPTKYLTGGGNQLGISMRTHATCTQIKVTSGAFPRTRFVTNLAPSSEGLLLPVKGGARWRGCRKLHP